MVLVFIIFLFAVDFELKLKCTKWDKQDKWTNNSDTTIDNIAYGAIISMIQHSTALVLITLLSVAPVSEDSSQNVESQNVNFPKISKLSLKSCGLVSFALGIQRHPGAC